MSDQKRVLRASLANRLQQLGDEELDSLEIILYDELEVRSGTILTNLLTTEQAERFGHLVEADDEEAMSAFLDREIPNYRQIVIETMEALIEETAQRIEEADQGGNS